MAGSAAAAQGSGALQPLEPTGDTLTSVTPTFRWIVTDAAALPRPIAHRLRIGRDSAFTWVIVDTVLENVERYDLRRPVKPGRPVYWRVDALAATGARDSLPRVGPVQVPAWATLTTPNDPMGTNLADPRPTLSWTSPAIAAPPGPFGYDVFVHRASTGDVAVSIAGLSAPGVRVPVALETNVAFTWAVVARAGADTSLTKSVGTFLILDPTLPQTTLLFQNFPNPFPAAGQEVTCLWFDLSTTGVVELEILDLRGNLVRRLVPGPDFPAILSAGRYGRGPAGGATCDPHLTWDGTAADGRVLPPGVYLAKLKATGRNFFRRIVFRGRAR